MLKDIENLEIELKEWLVGATKIAIIGIGNELKKDDFVGSFIARKLKNAAFSKRVLILDCGTVPESYTDKIIEFNPSHILVIDAAHLGMRPNNFKLVDFEKVHGLTISTHNLPLSLFAKYLEKTTGAKTALLGIQPSNIEFEMGLTKELSETAEEISKAIIKIFS